MRANLQLICCDPSLTRDDNTKYRFLDLSVRLSGYVLDFCIATPNVDDQYTSSGSSEIVFAGTLQQHQECLKLIIQEVWQNSNNQLDAWSQLCVLACVKKYFSTYWKIAASDDGSEADKITDDSDSDSDSDSWSTSSESLQRPTLPSAPYSASPSKHPSAKAQPHQQPDP
jgi:hypothetical protein